MKRATCEIWEFNAEERKNGNIQRMCVAVEFLPKWSATYDELVRGITKKRFPSNSEEEGLMLEVISPYGNKQFIKKWKRS